VVLAITSPAVAWRDCGDCKRFVYNETTGERHLFQGQPQLRPKGTFPPCHYGACAKGTPESDIALWPQNKKAYLHYRECVAVNRWPDDSIVSRNAATIAAAINEAKAQLHEHQKRRV
jgi:hypothetical protein